MNIFLGILIGILVMTVVVTVHEFGHFIIAKKNGVNVKEFGIGFPPKAKTWLHVPRKEVENYCKKFKYDDKKAKKILEKVKRLPKKQWFWIPLPKDEWYEKTEEGLSLKSQDYLIFSLNWLPIGGFCQMDGETNIDTRKGTFGAASLWSKTKILFAGVTMNWILAVIIFTILAFTSGIPKAFDGQYYIESDTIRDISSLQVYVAKVYEDTPAEKSGIKALDIISKISYKDESVEVKTASDIQNFNAKHKGETVLYEVIHDDETEEKIEVKLNQDGEKYTLGIAMDQLGLERYKATWSAPVVAVVNTVQITGETFRGLGQLLSDVFSGVTSQFSSDEAVKNAGKQKIEAAGDSVAGPVGIIGVLFPSVAQTGVANVLFLAAIISISLACMNVLPIPALDGGRWFLIILFEKILRRKLTPEIENRIVSRAFIVLLIIAALVTVLDVMKILR